MNKYLIIGLSLVIGATLVFAGVLISGKTVTEIVRDVGRPIGAIPSVLDVGPEFGMNGLQTHVVRANFKSSTTTLLSIASPNVATATIDFLQLLNTGVATSTYAIVCGAADSDNGYPTREFISTNAIATSTNFGTIVSGVRVNGGSLHASGTATGSVMFLGPSEYFVCKANTYFPITTTNGAFTNTNEVFDGSFKLRIVE